MAQTAVLYKVLQVKEQEKNQAQIERVQAVEQFEIVANKLYDQLRKKEVAEKQLSHKMREQFTMEIMKEQSRYINNLSSKIVTLQHHVQQARKKMEITQELLNEAFIEVKKIEKMIDIREQEKNAEERMLEAALMDEMSMRQYNKQVQNR